MRTARGSVAPGGCGQSCYDDRIAAGAKLMNLQLSIGITSNPRTWPIIDGTVTPDGIDLVPTVLHPSELFWRQLHFAEFAVSEMSCSSFLITTASGDTRFVGLPIFTTRRFFHTAILVRREAAIATPSDLKGKRVGVPEYQQTAALWARGVLAHEFGVHPKDMEFWMERTPEKSHGGATGFTPPPGVTVNQIPADKSIGSMMLSGELDAVLHYLSGRNLVDRSRADLAGNPDFKYLFADPVAEGIRYYRKTGLLPINHQTVVRRDVFDKEPWVALNLIKAFNRANEIANAQRVDHVADHLATGLLSGDAKTPVIHHGVKANRKVIETIAKYSLEQGLTPRLVKVEELYAPSALDT
jgi:4,5-dihydroxyphthalate decarboxylase